MQPTEQPTPPPLLVDNHPHTQLVSGNVVHCRGSWEIWLGPSDILHILCLLGQALSSQWACRTECGVGIINLKYLFAYGESMYGVCVHWQISVTRVGDILHTLCMLGQTLRSQWVCHFPVATAFIGTALFLHILRFQLAFKDSNGNHVLWTILLFCSFG